MAEAPLRIEYEYFPDPTRGRPVSNGAVYVGVENTDPVVPGNRVDVVLIQQDGSRVTIQPAQQPFSTSPGGVIEYLGSPAIIRVDGTVAIAVHDSLGDQVYYNPLANQAGGSGGAPGAGTVTSGIPLNGSFEVETVAGQADNWTYAEASNGTIDVDSTNQAHGFKSLRFLSGSAAGAGTATSDRFNVLSSGKSDLRFSLKSTSANVLNTVGIRYYDSAGTILTTNTVFSDGATNPASFASYIVNDLAPTGAIEAEIILTGVSSGGATTSGTTWFDDVALDSSTGTFEIGDTGSIIQTTDVTNGVNKIGVSNAATGQPPTIDQLGPDDIGVLIEQVLIKNGIVTADLIGDVTGNADTVTVVPLFTGDIDNDDGNGNPTNNLVVINVPPNSISFTAATGDQEAFSSIEQVGTTSGTFLTARKVRVPYAGVFKLSVSMRTTSSAATAFVDVLVDGVLVASFTTTSTSPVAVVKTTDITVVKDSVVELQYKTGDGSGNETAFVSNFILSEADNRISFVEI